MSECILLINYSNPMAMICWAINDYSHIKSAACVLTPTAVRPDSPDTPALNMKIVLIGQRVSTISPGTWILE